MIILPLSERLTLDKLWHVLWDHLSQHKCEPTEREDHTFVGPCCYVHETLCRNLFSLQYELESRRRA